MSNPGDANDTPITSVRQLAEHIAAGCKPASQFRIGTEHEKFGFRMTDLKPPPYRPPDGQPGSIRDAAGGIASATAARRSRTTANTIGLALPDGGARLA